MPEGAPFCYVRHRNGRQRHPRGALIANFIPNDRACLYPPSASPVALMRTAPSPSQDHRADYLTFKYRGEGLKSAPYPLSY